MPTVLARRHGRSNLPVWLTRPRLYHYICHMRSIKDHPFAVQAFFESSLVITYAVPAGELRRLIPECLELDTYNDQAFIAVAMVRAQDLRPKGFPRFAGSDFFLLGFRIFVRYTTTQGKRLRGLYILRSETDKRKMAWLGNFFTRYSYTLTDISFTRKAGTIKIFSRNSGLDIEVDISRREPSLPAGSPFRDWKEARRFAGPLPFTFSYQPASREVLIVEGVRENWIPAPVEVIRANVGFIEQKGFAGIMPANAFIIENIPYHWKKGRTEIWNP